MDSKLIDWFQKCKQEHFALGAFNIDNFEILKAVAQAAKDLSTPVIAEVSPGEVKYLGLENFVALVNNLKEETGTPIFLNLDHGNDVEVIKQAIELGFDMVHFDGSELGLEENLKLTTEVVEIAHAKGILVEGEMDHFPGTSEVHDNHTDKQNYTDIEKAKTFVSETDIDIFAVFIGNKHGVFQDGSERLDIAHLDKLRVALPETFFSLHGGSGIPVNEVKSALTRGIVKVNVNTELRVALKETLENVLKGNPDEWAVYKLMPPAIEAVREVVEGKIKLFNPAAKL